MKTQGRNYSVIFQKEPEGGYTVLVPSLPGCVSYGKKWEEAKKMAKEAIELYLDSTEEHEESLPDEKETLYGQIQVNISV